MSALHAAEDGSFVMAISFMPCCLSQSVERAILLSASLLQRNRGHKKKPSLHVSTEAVRIAFKETQREEGIVPSCIVSSLLKFLTFQSTIVLQLQIDFASGGWKIASALLRSLTRKTLPELCLVPPQASSLRGFRPRSRFYPQRNKSIIPKIQPRVCAGIFESQISGVS